MFNRCLCSDLLVAIVCFALIASVQICKPPDVLHMCQEMPVMRKLPQTLISHKMFISNRRPVSFRWFSFTTEKVLTRTYSLFESLSHSDVSSCSVLIGPPSPRSAMRLRHHVEPRQRVSAWLRHRRRSLWITRLVH